MRTAFDELPRGLSALVVAGVGDGLEWVGFRRRSPRGLVYGFEPSPAQRVKAAGFPGPLLHYALWDSSVELGLLGSKNCTRTRPGSGVRAARLDSFSLSLGERAVLWLDCEGAELRALRGATGVLDSFVAVNVEVRTRLQAEAHYPDDDEFCCDEDVLAFLAERGFEPMLTHSATKRKRDVLCVRT